MLATLAATIFDPAGYIELDVVPAQNDGETRRRVNRVATLDGGAVVNDAGYSQADRVLELRWQADNAAREAAVRRMVEIHDQVHIALRTGVYLVALEAYRPGAAESTLRALVIRKLSP